MIVKGPITKIHSYDDAKLFNVKNLPPEFVVAQDHLFGLAEAKELGDPRIARQTLKALVATTNEQNRILGLEGFSQKRVALIKKFKKAPLENKIGIVNQFVNDLGIFGSEAFIEQQIIRGSDIEYNKLKLKLSL